jgi:hypothetical protein
MNTYHTELILYLMDGKQEPLDWQQIDLDGRVNLLRYPGYKPENQEMGSEFRI